MQIDYPYTAQCILRVLCRCKDCQNGYLLPEQPKIIGCPWKCDKCDAHKSHTFVIDLISITEAKVIEWTAKANSTNDMLEILEKLEEEFHPNHFLIFGVKKSIMKKTSTVKLEGEPLLQELEHKLSMCNQVKSLADILDPGLTMHNAYLLKTTAITRSELAKRTMDLKGPEVQAAQGENMRKAMQELKEASLCLKTPKP